MSDPTKPPNWRIDACPACNAMAAVPPDVRIGLYSCPHCGRESRFVRDCGNRLSVRLFDAGDLPGRVRVISGTFKGHEGVVTSRGPFSGWVTICVEVSGRIAPVDIELADLEEVR